MDNLDSEKLKQLAPQAWWAGYRVGRQEAIDDPSVQQKIIEGYLKNELKGSPATLTKPGSSSPGNSSPASPTAQPSSEPQPVAVSGVQAAINKQLGLDEATFVKFAR